MVTTTNVFHECDSCLAEVGGYARKELLAEGWKFHDAGQGRTFVMCGECTDKYAERRRVAGVEST